MGGQQEKLYETVKSNMKKPKLILIDNNLIFRQRLTFLINIENSAEIIGKASNGDDFIELLTNHHPDLILMDIDIPHLDGIGVVKKALKMLPGLKIFAFTMFWDDDYIINLIKIGVNGFVLKSSAITELEKDIHSYLTVENFCMNNQIINIINKLSVDKLQISTENKRITGKAKKLYSKFNLEVKQMEKKQVSF